MVQKMTRINNVKKNLVVFSVFATSLLCFVFPCTGYSYPENVRYGYASCASCHVSPSGGGVLTKYGREASEEFMGTSVAEGENAFLHGKVPVPEWIAVGGDLRGVILQRDTNAFKERWAFPMQADAEVALKIRPWLTGVASGGVYNGNFDSLRHYLLVNADENLHIRGGRFFPAFGILTPDHVNPVRRGLGFEPGRESNNFEVGYTAESGEILVNAILSSGQDTLADNEKGYSIRAAWFAGGRSQIGLSAMSVNGSIWSRDLFGFFAVTGITKSVYVLAEADVETKSPVDKSDASTVHNRRVVTSNKLGWELMNGLHLFASWDASVTTQGNRDPRQWTAGPGVQWFPRPHFELSSQILRKYDATWSSRTGYLVNLMGHYYL